VVDPWLSNGRDTCRGFDELLARAVGSRMTDAEKARALWWQQVQHRFHLEGDNTELMDPVKVLNVYGHNTCGYDSIEGVQVTMDRGEDQAHGRPGKKAVMKVIDVIGSDRTSLLRPRSRRQEGTTFRSCPQESGNPTVN